MFSLEKHILVALDSGIIKLLNNNDQDQRQHNTISVKGIRQFYLLKQSIVIVETHSKLALYKVKDIKKHYSNGSENSADIVQPKLVLNKIETADYTSLAMSVKCDRANDKSSLFAHSVHNNLSFYEIPKHYHWIKYCFLN